MAVVDRGKEQSLSRPPSLAAAQAARAAFSASRESDRLAREAGRAAAGWADPSDHTAMPETA